MASVYSPRPTQQCDPAVGAVAISYGGGDQDLAAYNIRGIHCSTAGTIKVDMVDGTSGITFTLVAGGVYPYRITKIYQSGSTMAGVVVY